jgi:hypothetical protein
VTLGTDFGSRILVSFFLFLKHPHARHKNAHMHVVAYTNVGVSGPLIDLTVFYAVLVRHKTLKLGFNPLLWLLICRTTFTNKHLSYFLFLGLFALFLGLLHLYE